jgi:hypothetical protein
MEQLITPLGRLVQGSLFVPNTKNMDGQPLVDKKGNPTVQYFIALAIEKVNPDIGPLLAEMQNSAGQHWPSGESTKSGFSWKIIDGDTRTDKEGFSGCWVLKFSSIFAPTVYEDGGTTTITQPDRIKRGDYVRVAGNYVGNKSTISPGMFLNLSMVEFKGYGEEIKTGPTGEVFGATQVGYIPSGMSTTPTSNPNSTFGQQVVAPMQQAPAQQGTIAEDVPDFSFLS